MTGHLPARGGIMTLPHIAVIVLAAACLAFSIYAAWDVRRNCIAARRDWERAARYRAEADQIRAATEELRRRRRGCP